MANIPNPILPGFHPDPCIIWAKGYYYLATSTFEWWPGVQIHRSRDLGKWELAGYALTRRSQLDMRGNPDSGGVWAPALSYADDRFWLVYSDVKCHSGPFKDVRNYLITAERVEGPWSDPVYLNRSGFDPSLFHDTDGRKWLVSQVWRTSTTIAAFAGIALQSYSFEEKRLMGEPANIFAGTARGLTEGPHLYKRDGYYYLVTAEGGTEWNHAVSLARSRTIDGPYESSPHNPLLTSSGNPGLRLKKAGHGSLVQSPEGEWYLAHLCSRHNSRPRCILGRETAIQNIVWAKGEWPRLATGGHEPADSFQAPVDTVEQYLPAFDDHFENATLNLQWNTLREPSTSDWLSLTEKPGYLRLRGRCSLQSLFDQSLVGFRLHHPRCRVAAGFEFSPRSFQQSAGLAMYYNTSNFYYAHVTADETGKPILRILSSDNRRCSEVYSEALPPAFPGVVEIGAILDHEHLRFLMTLPGGAQRTLGPDLDATILSDDYPNEGGVGLAFTGVFAALCAQDSSAFNLPADFDWFRYRALTDARVTDSIAIESSTSA
ncbi:glycoside hydrolase family 43 protein [Opitutus sp. GAS368]|uniref:glycoside hydrolase family 43 protein n=1 Tax=Opitutus sp. GAS368 TaxID=1882749 RepID=UPI00087931C0|nr:glycoside hydrolase family 43 protein [Opitutus sp. GAS368]SDS18758.1 xylan 1,4-beta-xylosidase [Opitutus sp. GAS368]